VLLRCCCSPTLVSYFPSFLFVFGCDNFSWHFGIFFTSHSQFKYNQMKTEL
jgi:hypothetical protein